MTMVDEAEVVRMPHQRSLPTVRFSGTRSDLQPLRDPHPIVECIRKNEVDPRAPGAIQREDIGRVVDGNHPPSRL